MILPILSYRKLNRKCGPFFRIAFHGNLSPVAFHDGLGDGQPQPVAALFAGSGAVGPVEALKNMLQMFGRDRRPRIINRQTDALSGVFQRNRHSAFFTGVFAGIIQEDDHQLFKLSLIAGNADIGDNIALDFDTLLIGYRL